MANGDVPVCIEPDCAEPDCAMASIPCNASPPLFHISHGMFHNVRFRDRRRFFKIPAERISRAIAAYEPTNNRSQLKKTENNELIIDAYNANPSSMKVALDNFATMPVSPKALILGDMRELGPTSDELHTEVVARIKEGNYDKVFLCGEHFQKAAGKDFTTYATTEELIEALRKNPLEGYHVLIKGSHGMALERVVEVL